MIEHKKLGLREPRARMEARFRFVLGKNTPDEEVVVEQRDWYIPMKAETHDWKKPIHRRIYLNSGNQLGFIPSLCIKRKCTVIMI